MTRTRGTNLPRMGEFNRAALLENIRVGRGELTRADLARRTGLSTQTVTNVVRRLLDEGLVVETALQRSGVGRPGIGLAVVPASRYAIGVHIDPAAVILVMLDLAGDVVAEQTVPTPPGAEPAAVLDVVAAEILALVDSPDVDRSRVLGIGIATPGPIDRERRHVLDPPQLTMWHDVPIADEVETRTGLPALLDKDVLAVASAVLWFPDLGQPNNAAVVYAGSGVAVGLILNGEVVRGVTGNAGEAGHLGIGRVFGGCPCGRADCLGGVLSSNTMLANAVARGIGLRAAQADSLTEFARGDAAVDELRALAAAGHTGAAGLLQDSGEALGSAMRVVCDLLDLQTVAVVGPMWARIREWAMPGLRQGLAVAAHTGPPVAVIDPGGGASAAAVGAACLLLDALAPRTTRLLIASRGG